MHRFQRNCCDSQPVNSVKQHLTTTPSPHTLTSLTLALPSFPPSNLTQSTLFPYPSSPSPSHDTTNSDTSAPSPSFSPSGVSQAVSGARSPAQKGDSRTLSWPSAAAPAGPRGASALLFSQLLPSPPPPHCPWAPGRRPARGGGERDTSCRPIQARGRRSQAWLLVRSITCVDSIGTAGPLGPVLNDPRDRPGCLSRPWYRAPTWSAVS